MPCPKCNGSERESLESGVWRCTSPRVIIREVGGPGLTNPLAGPGVLRHEEKIPCGAEYAEAGPGAFLVCACRTVAIGLCAACGVPVCGLHSELCAGRRLCEADNPRLRAEARRIDVTERAEAAAVALRVEWTERLREELKGAHPIERAVRVMTLLSEDEVRSRGSRMSHQVMSVFAWALGGYWTGDLMKKPTWDHEQVLEWFLGAVKTAPTPHQILVSRKVRGLGELKAKLVSVPGWTFSSGSTNHILTDDWHYPMTVLVDGRRGSYLDRPGQAPDHSGFTGLALREMASLVHLPSLPPRPGVG